jgi:hypothetical protein
MDKSLRVVICGTDGNSNFLTRIKSMSFCERLIIQPEVWLFIPDISPVGCTIISGAKSVSSGSVHTIFDAARYFEHEGLAVLLRLSSGCCLCCLTRSQNAAHCRSQAL